MKRDVLIGIGISGAICAIGIVHAPPIVPELTALFAALLGGLAILTVAGRQYPASIGVGATALVLLGGYGIGAGVLSGPAALLAAVLMAGAALLLGRALARGGVSGRRLPGGGTA